MSQTTNPTTQENQQEKDESKLVETPLRFNQFKKTKKQKQVQSQIRHQIRSKERPKERFKERSKERSKEQSQERTRMRQELHYFWKRSRIS